MQFHLSAEISRGVGNKQITARVDFYRSWEFLGTHV